jgi:diamine N-acetyltransferase
MKAAVQLREVTRESVRAVCALEVADDQRAFVAPNAVSIAQAYFYDEAWFRAVHAVHAGAELVGFVMLYDPTLAATPEEPDFFLWRLMIDRRYQGKGYGRAAVRLASEYARSRGARRLLVLARQARRTPRPLLRGARVPLNGPGGRRRARDGACDRLSRGRPRSYSPSATRL